MIGVTVPDNIRCITFEGPKEHPLIATELMMPILGVVRAKDFDDAVEQAVWLEHGNRHSAHIHSKNIDNITEICESDRYSDPRKERSVLCSTWIRRRRILYIHDRQQDRRGSDKRKHIHKEKTLRHDRQFVYTLSHALMTHKCVCRLACGYTFDVAEVYGARRQRDEAERNRAVHGVKSR